MVTDGNCRRGLYATLTSAFFGYDRRYVSLVAIRYEKMKKKTRIISSHRNLLR